nr:hypothetical protein Itr_chr01CG04000 [Ipomoea trifida]
MEQLTHFLYCQKISPSLSPIHNLSSPSFFTHQQNTKICIFHYLCVEIFTKLGVVDFKYLPI